MSRFVGIKDGRIQTISNISFSNKNLNVLEVPRELEQFSNDELISQFRYIDNEFRSKILRQNIKSAKIAFITNHAMSCGIAEYAFKLFPHIAAQAKDFRLFIEYNKNPLHSINEFGKIDAIGKVIECWERGKPLAGLANEVKKYNPDIVIINMEWGLFPIASHFLSLISQLNDYRVIPILHSVYPEHRDKSICESIFDEVIVHLDGAKIALENKGITGKVYVVPHGCNDINKSKLWNLYSTKYTILQSGYGLAYKGFDDAIRATAIIKQKYNDVFLTCLFSETKSNSVEHNKYYLSLLYLIDELKLQDNVAIVKGYKSDKIFDSFYRTNRISVFPYRASVEHKVYGASGSARLAFSKNIPVISSSIPHFSDLPTIKADTVEQLANEIDKLFSNTELEKEQLSKQEKYLTENSWQNCAEKIIKILGN